MFVLTILVALVSSFSPSVLFGLKDQSPILRSPSVVEIHAMLDVLEGPPFTPAYFPCIKTFLDPEEPTYTLVFNDFSWIGTRVGDETTAAHPICISSSTPVLSYYFYTLLDRLCTGVLIFFLFASIIPASDSSSSSSSMQSVEVRSPPTHIPCLTLEQVVAPQIHAGKSWAHKADRVRVPTDTPRAVCLLMTFHPHPDAFLTPRRSTHHPVIVPTPPPATSYSSRRLPLPPVSPLGASS
jgi:hypothetical protein